jgi:hypothetical protein
MKNTFKKIALASVLMLAGMTNAAQVRANTLLYFSPNDYNYSVHLLHPYYDYWFEQGPLVEPIALQALQTKYADIVLCKSNETADNIIRITPSLFYNPQMRVYHSRLVATVFSGGGNVLGAYVGEAQQQGFNSIDVGTKLHLNKVYALAMQDLMEKIKIDLAPSSVSAESKLPCGLIGAQEAPKINFY